MSNAAAPKARPARAAHLGGDRNSQHAVATTAAPVTTSVVATTQGQTPAPCGISDNAWAAPATTATRTVAGTRRDSVRMRHARARPRPHSAAMGGVKAAR